MGTFASDLCPGLPLVSERPSKIRPVGDAPYAAANAAGKEMLMLALQRHAKAVVCKAGQVRKH